MPAAKKAAGTSAARKATQQKHVSARKAPDSPRKGGKSAAAGKGRRARSTPADQLSEYRRKRDFTKTAEPSGAEPVKSVKSVKSARRPAAGKLRFVVQKHAASHLHYDLRLEVDGVMKSWAVPKGPSADPSVKRLAMQVEDHPISYNSFEGTIPAGEYGGGTVMLWDTGTYAIEGARGGAREQEQAAAEQYERGEMKVVFHGRRLKGSYVLVRTKQAMRGSAGSGKPSWLLIKHRDGDARPEGEYHLTEANTTSVTTGRTMDEIRGGE